MKLADLRGAVLVRHPRTPPVVTITYAVAVIAAGSQLISNTARIGIRGYPVIERIEAILVDVYAVYLPIVLRRW